MPAPLNLTSLHPPSSFSTCSLTLTLTPILTSSTSSWTSSSFLSFHLPSPQLYLPTPPPPSHISTSLLPSLQSTPSECLSSTSFHHCCPHLTPTHPHPVSLHSCLFSFLSNSAPSPEASAEQSTPSVLLCSPLLSYASVQREGDPPRKALSYVMRSSGD